MAVVQPEDFTRQGDFKPALYVRTHRTNTDLEHLGTALGKVLERFKAELVEVVHQDYDKFIGLSGELRGTEQTVGALRAHLAEREAELKVLRLCRERPLRVRGLLAQPRARAARFTCLTRSSPASATARPARSPTPT